MNVNIDLLQIEESPPWKVPYTFSLASLSAEV